MLIDLMQENIIESPEVNPRDKLRVIRREIVRVARNLYGEGSRWKIVNNQLELMDREIRNAGKDEDILNKLVINYDDLLFRLSAIAYG